MSRTKKHSLQYFLNILEDPRYPSVGPHLKLLSFAGLWRQSLNDNSFTARFKQFLFYLIISFFFSQYVKCLIKFDAESIKLVLQYAPFHMGIVKSCFFQKDHQKWKQVIDYMSFVERNEMAQKDRKQDSIIHNYIKRNRRVSYFFFALAFFSNFSIFTEPYLKNQINVNGTGVYLYMFDGYTPFSREPPGYYVSMIIQTVLGYIMSAYVVGWDTLVVSIMIFFAGQLRLARLYCSEMIVSAERSRENIAKCHHFYTNLVQYHKMFNSLISPVMFVYLITISVNLGVCIIQMAQIQDDLKTLVSSFVFINACLIQLLLFYWYSNEVILESMSVSYSTFESDWPESNKNLQKQVALLGITTTKKLVFKAGPFNEMSLATFVGILRASYSFYTLLKGNGSN